MRIGHAVMNEYGTARGGVAGDSTRKEIRAQEWYKREWTTYLEPIDADVADRAVSWMERICEDDRFGYDQDHRWSGYQEIKNKGFDGASKGDFDCSSLVLSCYIFAGLNLLPMGYTKNMGRYLMETGYFIEHTEPKYLTNPDHLKAGGVLIGPGHTCMVLETSENPAIDEVFPADKAIGRVTAKGSVRVRNNPQNGTTLKIVHRGDTLDFFTEDLETGWLYTRNGWITNNPRYVEVEYYD